MDHPNPKRSRGLSRRAFLGGAGAAISLPFLPSLQPGRTRFAAAAAPAAPQRLVFFYVPNGVHMDAWRPTTAGPGYALPPILAPLAPVRDDVLVLTGLANAPASPDGDGAHAAGTGGFLTCRRVRKTEGDNIDNGVSVDQVAAAAFGDATRLASLQLGLDGGGSAGDCDSGYSCAYARNISWAGPQTPLPKLTNPQLVFDRLFAGFDPTETAAEREGRRARRKSVLDYVATEATRLQARAGLTDRRKIDELLTGVRDVERQIDAAAAECSPPDYPERGLPVDQHARVMLELTAVALSCDVTRIVTFMLANAASNRTYTWLDPTVTDGHHDISHHGNDPDNHRKLEIINRWEVGLFASLVERLAAIPDADGASLLDNSQVYFGSEISDGDWHNSNDLPVLLAGRAGGAITPGRHIAYPDGAPVADLFIAMLNAAGVPATTFGDDGVGPLPGLAG